MHQIAENRRQIEERIEELRPLVAEFKRLQRALEALESLDQQDARRSRVSFPPEVRKAQIIDLIHDHPRELRRKEIAGTLGLTQARVGHLVKLLIDEGLVKEAIGRTLQLTDKGADVHGRSGAERPPYSVDRDSYEFLRG